MTITIYELMGLIKDGEAPKEIKIDNKIWFFYKSNERVSYVDDEKSYLKSCSLNFNYYIENNKLNDEIEILPEENDEWEDIEEIKYKDKKIYNSVTDAYNTLNSKEKNIFIPIINQLIKNQKYLKRKLESKDENN